MKCLSLIVNGSTKNEIVELLQGLDEVSAYTIFPGEGHYRGDIQPFESARDEVMGFVPRIRIDLFVADADVSKVVDRIRRCSTCSTRRGVYWTSPVDAMGEL